MQRSLQLLTNKSEGEFEEIYRLFDMQGKGYFDSNSLMINLRMLGYEIGQSQVDQMLEYLDLSGKGVITKKAFFDFMHARLDTTDQEAIRAAYEFYETNKEKGITVRDLQRVAEQVGENSEEQCCLTILKQVDKNEDGLITFQEFERVIRKTSSH